MVLPGTEIKKKKLWRIKLHFNSDHLQYRVQLISTIVKRPINKDQTGSLFN